MVSSSDLPVQGHSVDLVMFLFHLIIYNLITAWPDLALPFWLSLSGDPLQVGKVPETLLGAPAIEGIVAPASENRQTNGRADGFVLCLQPLLVTKYEWASSLQEIRSFPVPVSGWVRLGMKRRCPGSVLEALLLETPLPACIWRVGAAPAAFLQLQDDYSAPP